MSLERRLRIVEISRWGLEGERDSRFLLCYRVGRSGSSSWYRSMGTGSGASGDPLQGNGSMSPEHIRTTGGILVALIAAAWAYSTGETMGWVVSLLAAGVVDPQTVLDWLTRSRSTVEEE